MNSYQNGCCAEGQIQRMPGPNKFLRMCKSHMSCQDLTQAQCQWLATKYKTANTDRNYPDINPCRTSGQKCQRRPIGELENRVPPLSDKDRAVIAAAQQAHPSQPAAAQPEPAQQQGVVGGIASAFSGAANALVSGVRAVTDRIGITAPPEDADFYALSPEQAASGSTMSIRRIKELRNAGRPPIRKKSSRRRSSRRRTSRRRSARKSRRRSSRRRSSRRSIY